GTRRHVCELCTVRANHQGWIRESEGPQIGHRGARSGDRRPLLGRLRARRERRRQDEAALEGYSAETLPGEEAPEPVAPAPVPEAEVTAPREPRHVHAVPTSEELKMV